MRPSRRLGVVTMLLLCVSGCAGVQSRLRWPTTNTDSAAQNRTAPAGWFSSRFQPRTEQTQAQTQTQIPAADADAAPTPTSASTPSDPPAAPSAGNTRPSNPETEIWPVPRSTGLSRFLPILGSREQGPKGPSQPDRYPSYASLTAPYHPPDDAIDRLIRRVGGEPADPQEPETKPAALQMAATAPADAQMPSARPGPAAQPAKLYNLPETRGDVALQVAPAEHDEPQPVSPRPTTRDETVTDLLRDPLMGEAPPAGADPALPRREPYLIPAAAESTQQTKPAAPAPQPPAPGPPAAGPPPPPLGPTTPGASPPPPPLAPEASPAPRPAPNAGPVPPTPGTPSQPAPATAPAPARTTAPAPAQAPAPVPVPAPEPVPAPATPPSPAAPPAQPVAPEPAPTAEPGPRPSPAAPEQGPSENIAPAPEVVPVPTSQSQPAALAPAGVASAQAQPQGQAHARIPAAPSSQAGTALASSQAASGTTARHRWSLRAWLHSLHQPAQPQPQCQLPAVMFPPTYQACMASAQTNCPPQGSGVRPAPQSVPQAGAAPPCTTCAAGRGKEGRLSWCHYGMLSDFFEQMRIWRHGCACPCHNEGYRFWRGNCKKCTSKQDAPAGSTPPSASPQSSPGPNAPTAAPQAPLASGSRGSEAGELAEGSQVLERIAAQGLDKAP